MTGSGQSGRRVAGRASIPSLNTNVLERGGRPLPGTVRIDQRTTIGPSSVWITKQQMLPLIGNKILSPRFKHVSYPLTSAMDDDSTPPPPYNDAPAPPPPVSTSGSPTDFLKGVVGKRVVVRLTSGVDYRGISHSFRPPLKR